MRWDRIGLIWRLDNKAAVPVKPIRNKALSDGGAGESSVALDGSESDMATRSNSTRLVLKDPSLAVSAHSFDLVHIPAEGILLETEADCIQFLYSMKWPNGFVCPYCSCKPFYKISTRRLPLYECASCRRQTSLITHTVMEGSRTPLQKWFQAIRLLACEGPLGVSANYLSSVLKVTYKTAWSMLHRIRAAMGQVQAGAALSGEVTITIPVIIIHICSTNKRPACLLELHCLRRRNLKESEYKCWTQISTQTAEYAWRQQGRFNRKA